MQTLLVTVDSLRADHLAQYGYERDTMPAVDRLAEAGTVFEHAFSNGPYTRISIPSFQTSHHLAYEAMDEFPTIASILSAEGETKTAVVGTQTGIGLVDGDFRFGETIDLGRDSYHEKATSERTLLEELRHQINRPATKISKLLQQRGSERLYNALRKPYNALFKDGGFQYLGYTSAEQVTDQALSWLDSNAESDFFLWIHYMEAHRPYGVHDDDPAYLDAPLGEDRIKALMKKAGLQPADVTEQERQLLVDLYDSDVRYCSRHLDRLFDGLEDLGLWDECNVLFSSDHGEEFREHGAFFHRNYPYDELTHVPLIVKTPTVDAPERISETRELLDLAPTITSFHLSDSIDPEFEGTHLFEGDDRTVFSLGQPNEIAPAVAVRTDEWRLIASKAGDQLYDIRTDPDEQRNVIDDNPAVAAELRDRIPEHLVTREVNPPRAPKDDVDREQLEALGYMELRD
ncbi:sulfatase [Haloferax mediterranei ATCC 33500]|uniref:Sulfatase n=1 Tax=Haloferax mediterranei (strain ATCC 33500 / DSM 1411 / JCM 8866 / NBRC 14739 / NCIMB 2177 / R-4) TaxID=523841 RepID=I3R1T9_HALMT|nr:sulfatase [Haloferax mediterranei]AFK18199.1 arylsulfatase [Haloferax mediterranei ATCC 33500]AHZ22397.1 sulfatase [Haloferax mediterranei ATCC 33500]EMA02527.1 arylsulfatase [Haloferax mediterranei ATCC 33500]MDX5988289.1 sulfatase [Haloferax mediterranei ATCC 33500]QCQ74726.1 sulfatase [Haloferax mediterranei ATCC 33500]